MGWIEEFLLLTDGLPTPALFRQWGAIGTLACAMERRLYIRIARKILHPNLYVMLVGPPGSGKSVLLDPVKNLLRDVNKFKISPDTLSKASLFDVIAGSHRAFNTPTGLFEQCSLSIIVDELGVFMSEHDLAFISVLNNVWGNPRNYSEQFRNVNAGKVKDIINPQINLLVGTQPAFLASILPEEAWGMGLMSRVIMVYSNAPPVIDDLFAEDLPDQEALISKMSKRLEQISQMSGAFVFHPEAADVLNKYNKAGYPPKPEHYKLQYYNVRRGMQLFKLCMIASISEGDSLIITRDHVLLAMDWLTQAEALMPDIFNDMTLKSDSEIIKDLHFWMFKEFTKTKKAIHSSRIYQYLSEKVPSEKVPRIIEIAERSHTINRIEGTALYQPRAQIQNTGVGVVTQ